MFDNDVAGREVGHIIYMGMYSICVVYAVVYRFYWIFTDLLDFICILTDERIYLRKTLNPRLP